MYNKWYTVNVCVLTTSNFAVGQHFKHDQTFEFFCVIGPVIHGHLSSLLNIWTPYQIELLFFLRMNDNFLWIREINSLDKICFYFHRKRTCHLSKKKWVKTCTKEKKKARKVYRNNYTFSTENGIRRTIKRMYILRMWREKEKRREPDEYVINIWENIKWIDEKKKKCLRTIIDYHSIVVIDPWVYCLRYCLLMIDLHFRSDRWLYFAVFHFEF